MKHREKLAVIRTVLLDEWDPIGVRNELAALDEYDAYLPAVLSLLERRASVTELADYLGHAATIEMGLVEDAERDRAVAERLLRLGLTAPPL